MALMRFGIIRMLPSGIPQCIEGAKGLAEAKAYVMRLASREPGEFFIYSEKNGAIVERFVCAENEDMLEDSKIAPRLKSHRFNFLS